MHDAMWLCCRPVQSVLAGTMMNLNLSPPPPTHLGARTVTDSNWNVEWLTPRSDGQVSTLVLGRTFLRHAGEILE